MFPKIKIPFKNEDTRVFPESNFIMNFDGCSKGNPGPSGIGAVIYKNGDEISASCENIGNRTNNESEYCALIIGLEEAIKLDITSLCVYGDSLLVINQANKIYKVKNENLLVLYEKFRALKCKFKYIRHFIMGIVNLFIQSPDSEV